MLLQFEGITYYLVRALPPLLQFTATAIVVYLVGLAFLFGYREHTYLYQIGDRKRAVDNWISLILPAVRRIRLGPYRAMITRDLNRSALRPGWDSSNFIAYQILVSAAAFAVVFVFFVVVLAWPFMLAILAAALGFLYPLMDLNSQATARFVACRRDLPYFIDYLGLAVGSGLDFNRSLEVVVRDAPASPLVTEFKNVIRNIRLGMSRAEALLEMDRRLESPQLKQFVQTLVQAMEMGTDIVQALTALSESFQTRRFQMAEEAAGKISVRMMMPLMIFVLPTVMIILIGPMLLSSPLFSGM